MECQEMKSERKYEIMRQTNRELHELPYTGSVKSETIKLASEFQYRSLHSRICFRRKFMKVEVPPLNLVIYSMSYCTVQYSVQCIPV